MILEGSRVRIVCLTCDKYLWATKPFTRLLNMYGGAEFDVVIVGCNHPGFRLPDNFSFYSMRNYDFPPNEWSNGLIQFLNDIDDELILIVLEDYWMIRYVNVQLIDYSAALMYERPDILKIDMSCDRLHARGDARDAIDYVHIGPYDFIYTPFGTPYRMSLQAAIWRRQLLLDLLEPGKSPWETEIHIDPPEDMLVMGTRQWPMRYANAIYKGKLDMSEIDRISPKELRLELLLDVPGSLERIEKK